METDRTNPADQTVGAAAEQTSKTPGGGKHIKWESESDDDELGDELSETGGTGGTGGTEGAGARGVCEEMVAMLEAHLADKMVR